MVWKSRLWVQVPLAINRFYAGTSVNLRLLPGDRVTTVPGTLPGLLCCYGWHKGRAHHRVSRAVTAQSTPPYGAREAARLSAPHCHWTDAGQTTSPRRQAAHALPHLRLLFISRSHLHKKVWFGGKT